MDDKPRSQRAEGSASGTRSGGEKEVRLREQQSHSGAPHLCRGDVHVLAREKLAVEGIEGPKAKGTHDCCSGKVENNKVRTSQPGVKYLGKHRCTRSPTEPAIRPRHSSHLPPHPPHSWNPECWSSTRNDDFLLNQGIATGHWLQHAPFSR